MKKIRAKYQISGVIAILVVCLLVVLFFLPGPGYTVTEPSPEMQNISDTVTQNTLIRLNTLATGLQNLAEDLTGYTPDDPQAQELLYEFYELYPSAAAIAWVDKKTDTVITAPAFSLTDILASPEISQLNESSFARDTVLLIGPVNSKSQGMTLCFAAPVHGTDGSYRGFVLISYDATLLQKSIPAPQTGQENLWADVWIINSEGTLIYHPNAEAIGQNLHQAYFVAKHPELKEGFLSILDHPAGSIYYRAYDLGGTQIVEKTGVWQTVSFGGQDLRVVVDTYRVPATSYPYVGNSTLAEQEALVHEMYTYARQQGMEKAVAAFNDPNGAFAEKGYGLFAYTMDGTALVTAKQVLIGENRLNYRGAYGIRPVNTMILQAKQGGGYVHYYRIVPYTENQALLTASYLRPVDDTWFVGASRAVSSAPHTYNLSKREVVTRAAQTVHNWVGISGKETALAMIMDPAQESLLGAERILAVSYDGILLADSQRLEKIGEDIFHLTDKHGASIIRESVMMAKQGGGYLYLEVDDPDIPEESTISLIYVEPMDDSWCILSMTPLETYRFVG